MQAVFEAILEDKEMMATQYADPIRKAIFMAMYEYTKQGNLLSDLPWFELTKFAKREKSKLIKIAA